MAGAASAGDAAQDMPQIIADESAADWVVDRFAGNSTAGPTFFQGPAREVGGLARCGACPLPDGRVLVPFPDGLAEVDADGTLRLLTTATSFVGTTAQVTAAVVAWNPADKRVYLGRGTCLGRLIERADGPCEIEVAAGTMGKAGFNDGPLKDATFSRIESVVINGRGAIVILDASQRIRKIENGQVTTLTAACRAGGGPVDGPLDKARFCLIGLGGNLCGGEDDDTLYLSDHWNFAVRRIDLKTMSVSTVAGMPKPKEWQPAKQTAREQRYNRNSDGPALTWAGFNSGCAYVCWDPFHKALWCGGPDENRFRWLKGDQVLTVIGSKGADKWPRDQLGVPTETVKLVWNAVVAVDAQGRAYLSASSEPHGLWRAYNKKEAGR
ncbi:MAG: hypothetical protein NTW87_16725 [Planctomycetota bacterium]|nr:hypothetical protein [Planctomycetota bacterium]